jgi:membrane protease YdiL (CAAX protease family)
VLSAISLIALQIKPFGWVVLTTTIIVLFFCDKSFRNDMFLIVGTLGILGVTPITTDISFEHIFSMGFSLSMAVALPYLITRKIYKQKTIRFPFHHSRRWYKKEIAYIFFTAVIAYLLLPFYLKNTAAYLNWTVLPGANNLFVLFLGTNALGIWDELFFVSTVLALLKKHFSFPIANATQGILFVSFLYELGFRGWAFPILYFFALTQGYIFKKTESLFYVITIHLTIDLILYLALINAHHPTWMPIFLIK